MGYVSTPYVGMTPPPKNGGHIKSEQMTRLKVCVNGLHEPYQALHGQQDLLTLLESITKVQDRRVAKTGKSSIF